jgi:hypothetical protein
MFVVVPLLFFVPGLLVSTALGLRGWRLAAVAPAVTFGLVATGGPLLSALHVQWSLLSFATWTVAVTVVLYAVARLWARTRPVQKEAPATDAAEPGPTRRARWEHLTVGAGVLLGMGVGALVFLRASRGLGATSQDWDAPFHANAVRWIAEHGQALPSAIAPTANLAAGDAYFYPVTYHSLLAIVVQLFGVTPSWVLNAAALTVVLIWPLGVAALGLAWRVPAPVVAVAAMVSTWFTAFPYDSLWRGPLWPFVAGLALLPGVLAAGRMVIERSPAVRTGVTIALAITGVVSLHPSIAFILLVYVVALVAALVLRLEPIRWRGSALPLLVTGALTVLVLLPVILPARTSSGGVQGAQWPEFASSPEAFGQVLLFSPVTTQPQWWLGLAAMAGLVVMVRQRRLLWLLGAYLVLGAAYAATASMDNDLVNTISGPFYNDAWRLAAVLPLAGVFAVGEAVVALGTWLAPRLRLGSSWGAVAGVSTAALVVLALLGNGAYITRNTEHLSWTYGDGPTVTTQEQAAYTWLADHLEPGERVMNDRLDGSVWMYAYAGVEPMEWTFYGAQADSVAGRLHDELNQMDDEPAVRRLMEEANVRYVFLGRGFVRTDVHRAPGLTRLFGVDGLEPVFRNRDAVIYEVVPAPVPAS